MNPFSLENPSMLLGRVGDGGARDGGTQGVTGSADHGGVL